MSSVDVSNGLHEELEALALRNRARAIGVALHDLETGLRFSLRGDRWFHAASTIKVAVLLAVFRAADEGRYRLDDSLHVRNRFFSAADEAPFRLSQDRDATPELYAAIGRTAKISSLAHAMICGSSNLATNLLLEFVGVGYARAVLREAQVDGVELRRGVDRVAPAVCGDLQAILKKGNAPAHDNRLEQRRAFIFQMPIPGEGHEQI